MATATPADHPHPATPPGPAALAGVPTTAGRSAPPGPPAAGRTAPSWPRDLRLAVARFRRPLAAVLVALAVVAGLRALAPPPAPTTPVLVAARDLAAGHVLAAGDVRTAAWPVGTAPSGLLPATGGRTLAVPLRAGEPVTDARVLGPGLLRGQPAGTVAVAVRPADPAAAGPVRIGDRVDVLAGAVTDGVRLAPADAERVAHAALVLAVPPTAAGGDAGGGLGGLTGPATAPGTGGVLWLAVDGTTARRIAGAQEARPLTLALRADGAPP